MTPESPSFLVGHAPLDPVTDAEPIRDFDTGYRPAPPPPPPPPPRPAPPRRRRAIRPPIAPPDATHADTAL